MARDFPCVALLGVVVVTSFAVAVFGTFPVGLSAGASFFFDAPLLSGAAATCFSLLFCVAGAVLVACVATFFAVFAVLGATARRVEFVSAATAFALAGLRALLDVALAVAADLGATFLVADFCSVADFFVVNL